MDYKPGMKVRAIVPLNQPRISLVHIDHVLPSVYEGRKLIVYRVWGKHKHWWHEIMTNDEYMDLYVRLAQNKLK